MAVPLPDVVLDHGGQHRRRLNLVPAEPVDVQQHEVDDENRPARFGALRRTVAEGVRTWWLLLAEPPSLRTWLAAAAPHRVPDDRRLRAAWHIDHWTTGLVITSVGVVLHLASAGLRWVACHPARRWTFVALACGYVAWTVQA